MMGPAAQLNIEHSQGKGMLVVKTELPKWEEVQPRDSDDGQCIRFYGDEIIAIALYLSFSLKKNI